MRASAWTAAGLTRLQREQARIDADLKTLRVQTPVNVWLRELDELEAGYAVHFAGRVKANHVDMEAPKLAAGKTKRRKKHVDARV